ncbi:GtrA family protein [Parapedobacter tibetensis]|uniref:GtrA family protein n=1 Tax=Parapedobacter tibetensis TaxID=2972951 RepID=UPI00214D4162|nr:GtrA family protein [Parapedobacter tibetensis]
MLVYLLVLQFFKFGLVGFIGLCIDFSITYILKEKLLWNKFIANAVGFSVAVVSNYVLNRIWTFESSDSRVIRQLLLFGGISLLGLGINTFILHFLHQRKEIDFYISKFIAVVVVFCWNFFINATITFT